MYTDRLPEWLIWFGLNPNGDVVGLCTQSVRAMDISYLVCSKGQRAFLLQRSLEVGRMGGYGFMISNNGEGGRRSRKDSFFRTSDLWSLKIKENSLPHRAIMNYDTVEVLGYDSRAQDSCRGEAYFAK